MRYLWSTLADDLIECCSDTVTDDAEVVEKRDQIAALDKSTCLLPSLAIPNQILIHRVSKRDLAYLESDGPR